MRKAMNESWQASVVLITSNDPGDSHFGTGFIIDEDELTTYLLTCAHVVRNVGGPEKVEINGMRAKIIASSPEEGADLAVLCTEKPLNRRPLLLSTTGKKGELFTTAGFQLEDKRFLIRSLAGLIGKPVEIQMRGETHRLQAWDLEIADRNLLQPGYSGSPVVDENGNAMGVVSTRRGDGKTGVAISIAAVQKIWPEMPHHLLMPRNRGFLLDESILPIAGRSSLLQYIFVSYGPEERNFAKEFMQGLKHWSRVHTTWIDHETLKPGTSGWEPRIYDVIRDSFVILYIASPHSKQSVLVRDVLEIANDLHCPICAIWIEGEKLIDCIPLDKMNVQVVDLRQYPSPLNTWEARRVLSQIIADRSPNHFLLPKEIDSHHYSWSLPGYLSVALGNGEAVAINAHAYQSFQSLLDTLYMEYLKDQYEPFTYGRNWILARHDFISTRIRQLAIPWNWLVHTQKERHLHDFGSSLQLYGLEQETHWEILSPIPSTVVVVLTNDPSIASCFTDSHSEKVTMLLLYRFQSAKQSRMPEIDIIPFLERDILTKVRIEAVAVEKVKYDAYKFSVIFDSSKFGKFSSGNTAFIVEALGKGKSYESLDEEH